MLFQNIFPVPLQIILESTGFCEEYLRVHHIMADMIVSQSYPLGVPISQSVPISGGLCRGKGILEHPQERSSPLGPIRPNTR